MFILPALQVTVFVTGTIGVLPRSSWIRVFVTCNHSLKKFQGSFCAALKASGKKMSILGQAGGPWWYSRWGFLLGQKRGLLRKARELLYAILCSRYKRVAAFLRKEINDAKRTYWAATCKTAAKSAAIYRIILCRIGINHFQTLIILLPSPGHYRRELRMNRMRLRDLSAESIFKSTCPWISAQTSIRI